MVWRTAGGVPGGRIPERIVGQGGIVTNRWAGRRWKELIILLVIVQSLSTGLPNRIVILNLERQCSDGEV